ncbi:MAG: SIS domain-containing protein, partial [Planctomycetota bacterium]
MTDFDGDAELTDYVRAHFAASGQTKRDFAAESAGELVEVARSLAAALDGGGKLLLCGNGGSAADCQHIAAEFVSVLTQDFQRRALPAIALTTDSSFLTARTNDFGFDDVYARQIEALGKSGDVLFGISTSGNSTSVLHAVEAAHAMQITTVGLTGRSGGALKDAVDRALQAPSDNVQHIQECHIAMGHV